MQHNINPSGPSDYSDLFSDLYFVYKEMGAALPFLASALDGDECYFL
jgi:hypothetical protein